MDKDNIAEHDLGASNANEQVADTSSETRESPSINERPKLRDALRSAVKEHNEPREKSPARKEAAASRERSPDGKFTPSNEVKPEAAKAAEAPADPKNSAPEPKGNEGQQPQTAVERPKAWGADKASLWSSLTPDVQAYIAKRENEVSDGFAKYGESNKRLQEYDAVMAPLRPMLQSMGQSDAQAIKMMIDWQQALSNPRNKVEAFKGLARQLGVDLQSLVPNPQGGGQQVAEQDPTAQHLRAALDPVTGRLNDLDRKLSAFEMQRAQVERIRADAEIAQFAKDHPHLDRVRVKMAHLMASQEATNLEDAYNQAIWAHPEVRAELLSAEQEKRNAEIAAAAEAERQKQAQAAEEKRKKDAEAAERARKANVSPTSATPSAVGVMFRKKGQTVRDSLMSAIKEGRAAV